MRSEASTANDNVLVWNLTPWKLRLVMFCVSVPVVSKRNVEMFDTVTFAEARKLSRRRFAILREADNIT